MNNDGGDDMHARTENVLTLYPEKTCTCSPECIRPIDFGKTGLNKKCYMRLRRELKGIQTIGIHFGEGKESIKDWIADIAEQNGKKKSAQVLEILELVKDIWDEGHGSYLEAGAIQKLLDVTVWHETRTEKMELLFRKFIKEYTTFVKDYFEKFDGRKRVFDVKAETWGPESTPGVKK